jgi:hypothetical protein
MAAVSRFISRIGEKALPLYKVMKKLDEFVWTDEADAALKDLKRVLSTALVLACPEDQEPMLLYMAATNRVISIVIVGRTEGRSAGVWRLETCLLCQRGPNGIQAALPSLPKIGI